MRLHTKLRKMIGATMHITVPLPAGMRINIWLDLCRPECVEGGVYPRCTVVLSAPRQNGFWFEASFQRAWCAIAGHRFSAWQPSHKSSGMSRCCQRCAKWQGKP